MALLQPQAEYRIRHSNKEPEWSSICNNVFDQYLDDDDLFGLDANQRGRSSSDESVNLFDFSGASEQSHKTDATSPIPSWDSVFQESAIEAQQPQAKEPANFWTKTLQALEQNAVECERKQQTLRSTKSHPDFLSLGGCPSPPAVPLSPTDQSFSAQSRVSRTAANGKRQHNTARSVSRGRPSGVVKTTVGASATPYAALRKCSASPPKMMSPSRYRSAFKDVWAEKLESSPTKYELRVPQAAFPASPPPSARGVFDDEPAAFGSPSYYPPLPHYDDQISPLTKTFQQAHIHTPVLSPAFNAAAHAHNACITAIPPLPASAYTSHGPVTNDTAPLYPERTSSIAPNNIDGFDFGFSTSPSAEAWQSFPMHDQPTGDFSNNFLGYDPFGPLASTVIPSVETVDPALAGLGISCDPQLGSLYDSSQVYTTAPANVMLHTNTISPARSGRAPYAHGLPTVRTPHRRAKSCQRSVSPSPPATEPRSSKRASSSRRTSRHRRAKSTNATPRQPQGQERAGFVNFTPHDSTKILSGVAPSGSSKTKARREKEAADKRRRLSQAAVRAVVEAGGDLEALDRAGLLS